VLSVGIPKVASGSFSTTFYSLGSNVQLRNCQAYFLEDWCTCAQLADNQNLPESFFLFRVTKQTICFLFLVHLRNFCSDVSS